MPKRSKTRKGRGQIEKEPRAEGIIGENGLMHEKREFRGNQPKYSKDEVLVEWEKVKDAPDEELTYSYAKKKYGWFNSACTHFGEREKDWYGFLRAMGKNEEDIEGIKEIGKLSKIEATRKSNSKYSRTEVFEKWGSIKNAPDSELTFAYAYKNYDWLSSAGTHFGKRPADWYGFLKAMGKSEEDIQRIRKLGDNVRFEEARKVNMKYSPNEVMEKWEEVMNAPFDKLTLAFARKNYNWFYSANRHFGGSKKSWYVFLEAMGKTDDDIKVIRKIGRKAMANAVSQRAQKYSKEEVLKKWGEIENEPGEKLTLAYARRNYDWFHSAGTHFGKKSIDWYGFLKAMGKTDEEIAQIRDVGRSNLGRYERKQKPIFSRKTIIIIDEMNGSTTQPTPRDYRKALNEMNSSDFIGTKQYDPKVVRIVLSTNGNGNKGAKEQTPAEKIRGLIGLGADWNDPEFAQKYKEALPHMAPWVVHRASILYLLGMAGKKQIEMPKSILSAASGPSEVFEAIDDLKQAFGTSGIPIPDVFDLDLSEAMLAAGNNWNQKIGDIRNTGFDRGSFDMVENSSIFQFSPEDVKTVLVETNRVLKDGGLIFLVSNGKKFSDSFYEGLKECGFENISSINEMLMLSGSGRKVLEETHGDKFAKNFDSALGNSVFILARKISDPSQNIDEKQFRFEDFGSAPKEIKEFVSDFREFLKGIEHDEPEKCSIVRENAIRRFADIRENHHDMLIEYRKVINRMQEKFWSVARKQPVERLKRLRVAGGQSGALPATWRTFGRKF